MSHMKRLKKIKKVKKMKHLKTLSLMTLAGLFSLSSHAEEVEITLIDELDGNLNSYCLDIKGGGKHIDPANGLQTHTCYSYKGALGKDQIFDSTRFASNELYLPKFDVCAQLASFKSGAKVALASCNKNPLQQIRLNKNHTITPVTAPTLCLTAGTHTKLGRGGTSQHQIKTLTLEKCTQEKTAYQQWRTRTGVDD